MVYISYICMSQDKETLQKNIEVKNNELALLKAKILQENQETTKESLKIQQKKLEEEIQVLHKQLDDLKYIEEHTAINTIQEEERNLKENIDTYRTYNIIKESVMGKKLKEILKTDEKVKEFAENIYIVVDKFIDQELAWFSDTIKSSVNVWIQFAMMETLVEQWAKWSTEFFEAFSSTKLNNSGNAFDGLYKSFWKLWSANKFYTLANKIQNITRYLSDHKNIIIQNNSIPELMNPYNFKELLNKEYWSNQVLINKLDINQILTLDATTSVDFEVNKDKLLEIVNSDVMNTVITEKSITSIQKSLKTADNLLDSRGKFSDKATELVDKLSGLFDISLPLLGNLWDLLGMDFPTDILWKTDKKWGVINFVLWILWFRWWLNGLHKKYIQEKIDELDIDNEFISATYKDFQKNTNSAITHDSASSTWKVCWLVWPDISTETVMKSKIPGDYAWLKKSIIDNINKDVILHPWLVQKFAPHAVDIQWDKPIVDSTKITETDIDVYLQYIIPKLATDDFITSDKVDKDSFALAVIGWLVGDKYFIEGINLGLLTFPNILNIPLIENNNITNSEIDFSKWKFTPEQIYNINNFINEMKRQNITNPYTQIGILSVIGKESGFVPQSEISYGNTSNQRIREIFGIRVKQYSDDELDSLKKDDKKFFDVVYGSIATSALWWNTGNTEPGDGYTYRGRGFNQITFKSNYKKYGEKIGEDLLTTPDRLNDPIVAAKAVLAFFEEWNWGKKLSTLSFTNKNDATRLFARINSGNRDIYAAWEDLAINFWSIFTVENNLT